MYRGPKGLAPFTPRAICGSTRQRRRQQWESASWEGSLAAGAVAAAAGAAAVHPGGSHADCGCCSCAQTLRCSRLARAACAASGGVAIPRPVLAGALAGPCRSLPRTLATAAAPNRGRGTSGAPDAAVGRKGVLTGCKSLPSMPRQSGQCRSILGRRASPACARIRAGDGQVGSHIACGEHGPPCRVCTISS